jgi:hypothetical protein
VTSSQNAPYTAVNYESIGKAEPETIEASDGLVTFDRFIEKISIAIGA